MPETVYEIRDAAGRLIARHVREDKPDGDKQIRWKQPDGAWGLNGTPLADLPLYGAELVSSLDKDELIIVTEGEKARDALAAANLPAVGTVTGTSGTPGAEALEALRDRRVCLWPDNDEAGREHMRRIAERLQGVTAETLWFTWDEAPDKGDAADHPAVAGGSARAADRLLTNLEGSPRWEPGGARAGSDGRGAEIAEDLEPRRGQAPWPKLADEALHGLPGEVVDAIEPHTEADPVALVANVLCWFGNAIGRGAFFRVGADRHHANLFAALVGETSKARKGMSRGHVRGLMHAVDSVWVDERIQNGLSSGEGLIYAVRDAVWGVNGDGDPVLQDEGVLDKRLLVEEPELAKVLKVASRDSNIVSPVMRQAWDGDRLQVMTRNNPMKATNTHVSHVGHITRQELLRYLTETETANGFANRFIWLLVKRSKALAFGGGWSEVDTAPLVRKLSAAVEFGKGAGEIGWGESARKEWEAVYEDLSEGKPGLFGAVTGRAEAQTVRLALVYAVMDRSRTIEREHIEAALALWDYAEASARHIFGDATGDPVADQIGEALEAAGAGMSRTEIRDYFGRNKKAERIDQALALLLKTGRVRREQRDTGGRPVETWFSK